MHILPNRHRPLWLLVGTLAILACQSEAKGGFSPPPTPPIIAVTPDSVAFAALLGGGDPSPRNVLVENFGGGDLDSLTVGGISYAAGQPTGWLAAAASGSPPNLTVQPSLGSLPAGQYVASVHLVHPSASNSPLNFPVAFTVTAQPLLALSTRQVRFTALPGQGSLAPQLVTLTNSGPGTLSGLTLGGVQYGSGQPIGWLTPVLSGSTAPATLSLSVSAASLPTGDYVANVTINAPGARVPSEVLVVALTVQAAPVIALSAITQAVSGVAGGSNPAGGIIQVTNGAGGTLTGLALDTIQYSSGGAGWLTATLSGISAPASITTGINIAGLAPGTYQATVPVRVPSDTTIGVVGLTVRLSLTAPPSISLSSGSVGFVGVVGAATPVPQSVLVSNGGTGLLAGLAVGSISYGVGASGWLSASLSSTAAPSTLALTVTSLPGAGLYTARVPLTSSVSGVPPETLAVSLAVSASTPAAVVGLNGNNQVGAVSTPLPQLVRARVLDANSNPFPGAPVVWTAGQGGAVVNSTTTSDANGEVTTNWVLGPSTGTQTLSVQTPGAPSFVFTALANSLPNGNNPNEPAGLATLTNRPFNNRVELTWYDRGDANFSIVSDPTAPASLPTIGQARFPLGFVGGSGPIMTNFYPTTKPTHIYLAFWIKLSPNWDGHSSFVNKVFHIWVNGANRLYLTMTGIDTMNFTPRIALQGVNETPISRNLSPNTGKTAQIRRGQWHFWEVELQVNTNGQSNGIARWWLDGVHLGEYTTINYLGAAAQKTWWENISWNPTWGGGGDIVPSDQYMWIDNVYLSGQ